MRGKDRHTRRELPEGTAVDRPAKAEAKLRQKAGVRVGLERRKKEVKQGTPEE